MAHPLDAHGSRCSAGKARVEHPSKGIPESNAKTRGKRRDREEESILVPCGSSRSWQHRQFWGTDFLLNDVHNVGRVRKWEEKKRSLRERLLSANRALRLSEYREIVRNAREKAVRPPRS